MNILGISAFYHDSAACLLQDGKIIAAAQEERFTRIKHDSSFPQNAIEYCLREGGLLGSHIDYIVFFEKPFVKFERLLETYITFAPRGFKSFQKAIPLWLKEKLFQKKLLIDECKDLWGEGKWSEKLRFSEHHISHAASAFYPSPFEEAIVLTMDGVGEWATASVCIGRGNELTIEKEMHFPHSLGLLYSAFTYYIGMRVNSGEYKLMGLAPYGQPLYVDKIKDHLVDIKPDGSFHLDQSYFDYCTGLTMTNGKFADLFGQPARTPETQITQFHMDIAASIQVVTEEIVLLMTRSLAKEYGIKNLCLAGGVALNCVANGKILKDSVFQNVWIQPAAGDAGGALGAALAIWYIQEGKPRKITPKTRDDMRGSYLGPSFEQDEIETRLKAIGAKFETLAKTKLINQVVKDIMDERAIGWFQGRMEFGPRALGGRSILGDPRSANMQKTLNLRVKYRESFRPFAPSVLREDVSEWFDLDTDSPYMLLVTDVLKNKQRKMTAAEKKLFGIDKLNIKRSDIPAITHVDYSARVQTVHKDTNPMYHALLTAFKKKTGCPVLVNTSFNVRGEPIVCTPEDAFKCFMGTDIETLVIGNVYLRKEDQDPALAKDYKNAFDLD
jgi:carbamoyltransferase